MTVMTDDSFLNLRERELLVYIYYNIYNTNLHLPPIFQKLSSVICHNLTTSQPIESMLITQCENADLYV